VEGLVVVDMDLSIEVVVGDSGDGCGCVRGSSRLGRHVWVVGMKMVFLKI
jgi:hypothetical protein